jgi:hypothetical protein
MSCNIIQLFPRARNCICAYTVITTDVLRRGRIVVVY